jgi:hypothetical protein
MEKKKESRNPLEKNEIKKHIKDEREGIQHHLK